MNTEPSVRIERGTGMDPDDSLDLISNEDAALASAVLLILGLPLILKVTGVVSWPQWTACVPLGLFAAFTAAVVAWLIRGYGCHGR
jgi:hypothetical protein